MTLHDFFWGSHGCDIVGPHYIHICSCGAIYDPLKDGEPYGYDTRNGEEISWGGDETSWDTIMMRATGGAMRPDTG
jgi:hypothetical protein